MAGKEEGRVMSKKLKIKFTYPEELASHFVNNIVVQHQPDFFVLQFFELWPPAIVGETDEDKRKALEEMSEVEAKCVSRIVVTPSKMRDFVQVMADNLKNYEAMGGLDSHTHKVK